MAKQYTIATRQSKLALWQANFVKQSIINQHPDVRIDLLPMKTTGDKFLKDKLQAIGGKRLFVKELEEAILDGRAHLAVHSMKDVPALLPDALCIGAILSRHSPFDALLAPNNLKLHQLKTLPVIGTSSLRRAAQIKLLRPDCKIVTCRGNLATRIKKLQEKQYDAIILATSGLQRMQLDHLISEQFDETQMLPACGQGALAIECRQDDTKLIELIRTLRCPTTERCVSIERAVNARLGGSCHVPIAIYCRQDDEQHVFLQAKVFSVTSAEFVSFSKRATNNDANHLAQTCAEQLLQHGAQRLIDQANNHE